VEVIKLMNSNLDDVTDSIEDDLIENHELIRNFIDPVEYNLKQKIGHDIDLKIIRRMVNQRHKVVHEDVKQTIQVLDHQFSDSFDRFCWLCNLFNVFFLIRQFF
jgi:hypothetical protein